jgi:phospholipase/carboxylesterase
MTTSTLDRYVHVHRPGAGPEAPALLLLHGTGATEHDLLPLAELLAPDAHVLSPRGRVTEGGMPRWFIRHAEGVFDQEDLRARTDELADWIPVAADGYGIDPTRLVAAGFSNGANIAASMLLRRPGTVRAALLFAPMVPFEPDTTPDLSGTAVFISAGRRDTICPPEQAERLAGLLSDAGAAVELAWHDGGHQLDRPQAEQGHAWLTRWRDATATDPDGIA